ncbi:hypothetical protein ACFLW0_01965 [Chloroflexota bacterium]
MNMPPMLMRLRIKNRNRQIGLWLPLFLIVPLFLVFVLALAPLVLLAAVILWPFGWGRPLVMVLPLLLNCLGALRGLEVDVDNKKEKILISFK